jgi:hypothetical protein
MISPLKVHAAKSKRSFVEVSPEVWSDIGGVQKRIDIKNSPPPIMATIEEKKADKGETLPPWAETFQANFFAKLNENTNEVKKLTTSVNDLTDSLQNLTLRVDDVESETDKLKVRATQSEVKVLALEHKCDELTTKLARLEDKVLRGEIRDKHKNLIFYGLKEKLTLPKEVCKTTVMGFLREHLSIMEDMEIGRCHRLGSNAKPTGRPRPIIASFVRAQDRDEVWGKKTELKETDFYISPDLPKEIEERRAKLLPVFKLAKSMVKYQASTYLSEDRLTIDKKKYGINNLHTLPADLSLAKSATQRIGEVTVFFTSNSPLSNHYMQAPIEVKGKRYLCNEQYYFANMATAFRDNDAYKDVMKQKEPGKILQAGKKATNHTNVKWQEMQYGIMLEANIEKYRQNAGAREALRATGDSKLGEATKQSSFWGTGLSLYHKDRGNSDLWTGQNKMGEILTLIRGDLPKGAEEMVY